MQRRLLEWSGYQMKIIGDRIRYYRRIMGLSQKDLAAGICTQATISLIEKQNKLPSIRILMNLCERLNIHIDDVIVNSRQSEIRNQLNEVRQHIIQGNFDAAKNQLDRIKARKVSDRFLLKQIYAYNGLISLLFKMDGDKAIFYFNQALNQRANGIIQQDVVAIAGLILAYIQKSDLDAATSYVQQLQSMVHSRHSKIFMDAETKLFVDYALSVALFKAGNVAGAKSYIDQGIEIAKAKQTILFLAVFYGLSAFYGQPQTAKDQVIALAMAEVVHTDLARLLFNHDIALKQWF